jgi:hypothetical protein
LQQPTVGFHRWNNVQVSKMKKCLERLLCRCWSNQKVSGVAEKCYEEWWGKGTNLTCVENKLMERVAECTTYISLELSVISNLHLSWLWKTGGF